MGIHYTNTLLRFARRWFDERVVAQVFEPLLADHQREWLNAAPSARLRIAIRTSMAFLVAMVTVAPRALLLTPTPASTTRRILARIIIFVGVTSTLMALPLLTELRTVPPGRLLYLLVLLLPAGVTLVFPFAMGFAVDGIRRSAAPTQPERLAALRTALVGVVFLVIFHGWITPAANHQFRTTVASERWLTPSRGARELTTLQLIQAPWLAQAEGRERSHAIQRELHSRASVALLPIVLIWLRWRAINHPSTQWLLPAWLSATVTIGAYLWLRGNDVRIESLFGLAPGTAAWLPLVMFVAVGWIRARVADRTVTSVLRA